MDASTISSIASAAEAKIVISEYLVPGGRNPLTPLLPVILIVCVASDPGANSALDIAFNCSFCVFGTAACSATLEID